MAPLTRRAGASIAIRPDGPASRGHREDSWDFANSEARSENSRESSVIGSYQETDDAEDSEQDGEDSLVSPDPTISGFDEPHIKYRLWHEAKRVGNEIEEFAKQLDRSSELVRADLKSTRAEAFELAESYKSIAQDTLKRLAKDHGRSLRAQRRKRRRQAGQGLEDDSLEITGHAEDDESEEDQENTDPRVNTTVDDLKHWEEETRTWDLLHIMLRCQYPDLETPPKKLRKIDSDSVTIHDYSSEEKVWRQFLIKNDLARERNAVMRWLEMGAESAGEDLDLLVEQLDEQTERGKSLSASGGLHTNLAIKKQKRLRSWTRPVDPNAPGMLENHRREDGTESLPTQADPDAVSRQGRKLEKADEFFERAIWLGCWELLRRGSDWDKVREWCRDRKEGWRAISMHGPEPVRQRNIDSHSLRLIDESEHQSDNAIKQEDVRYTGNRSHSLWRRMCHTLVRNTESDVEPYERAVYGLLGGDLESVLKVCRSWDDFLYAHYNSLLLSGFDSFLAKNYPKRLSPATVRKFPIFDSIQYHGEDKDAGKRLINALRKEGRFQQDAEQPMKIVQGVLVANDFSNFAYQQGLSLAELANAESDSAIIPRLDGIMPRLGEAPDWKNNKFISYIDHDGLRVIAHILIIYQDLGLNFGHGKAEVATENIIVAYMGFLRTAGKMSILPLYASRLSKDRGAEVLGRLLIDVTLAKERRDQVKLMKNVGMDPLQVARSQLAYVLERPSFKETPQHRTSQIKILEEPNPNTPIRETKRQFIGVPTEDQRALISSFEWYLLADLHTIDHWRETFFVGASLYYHFFSQGHLGAARLLSERMRSTDISCALSRELLGEPIDVGSHGREYESQGMLHDLQDRLFVLYQHMRLYVHFEALTMTLSCLEEHAVVLGQQPRSSTLSSAAMRNWKARSQNTLNHLQRSIDDVTQGWLQVDALSSFDLLDEGSVSQKAAFKFLKRGLDKSGLALIRRIYIPEIFLAFHSVLYGAGHALSRENLLLCMNLSNTIVRSEKDLLAAFIDAERLRELVDALAYSSKALLAAKERGSSRKGGSKIAGAGSTLDVWTVKPTKGAQ